MSNYDELFFSPAFCIDERRRRWYFPITKHSRSCSMFNRLLALSKFLHNFLHFINFASLQIFQACCKLVIEQLTMLFLNSLSRRDRQWNVRIRRRRHHLTINARHRSISPINSSFIKFNGLIYKFLNDLTILPR